MPLFDEDHAAFIQHEVSVNVAARDDGNVPVLARAWACRPSADRRQVTVFLDIITAAEVLANLRQNGSIAVAVNRPDTHQSLQLKGSDAVVHALAAEDFFVAAAGRRSFFDHLQRLGWTAAFCEAFIPDRGEADLAAVTFTVAAAFDQTPGPRAGQQLGEAS